MSFFVCFLWQGFLCAHGCPGTCCAVQACPEVVASQLLLPPHLLGLRVQYSHCCTDFRTLFQIYKNMKMAKVLVIVAIGSISQNKAQGASQLCGGPGWGTRLCPSASMLRNPSVLPHLFCIAKPKDFRVRSAEQASSHGLDQVRHCPCKIYVLENMRNLL